MKPEPSELVLCGCRSPPLPPGPPRRFLKKSSKNSSNGEPGGSCGIAPLPSPPPPLASTVCEVEMLTTASITFSATSAMPSGPRASAGAEQDTGRRQGWRQGRSRPAAGAGDGSGLESHRSYQLSLLAKSGRNLKSTVRPNGVTAQAFEPDIPLP